MRRKKLMIIILIVVLAVLIVAGATVTVFALNNSPKKIFLKGVDSIFSVLETEEKYNTIDSTVELTATIDSEDVEYDEMKQMLEPFAIIFKTKTDIKNNVSNNNLVINYQNEETTKAILDADLLLQDNKLYVLYEEIFEKYIEIPYETEEVSQTVNPMDEDTLMKELKKTIKSELEKQDFEKEKVTLNLDGQDIKVKKNTINLSEKEAIIIVRDIFQSLNANNKFLNSLGSYKTKWTESIPTMIEDLNSELEYANEQDELAISLYTKGMFNEFVKFDIVASDLDYNEKEGFELIKINENKYKIDSYIEEENVREEQFYVVIQNNPQSKTNGQILITIGDEEETLEFNCQYTKAGAQTSFTISTTIEEIPFTIEGTMSEEDTSQIGDVKIKVGIDEETSFVIRAKYNIIYNINVEKQNVSESVLVENLTEEELQKISENFENSLLYTFADELGLIDYMTGISNGLAITSDDSPKVEYGDYVIDYTIPEGYEPSSFNGSDSKAYYNDNMDSIMVSIEEGTPSEYMKSLEDDYILTSEAYKDKSVTNTDKYEVGDKKYTYRALVYTYEDVKYMKICFVYELDDKNIYVVTADGERGKISMGEIESFLDVEVTKATNNSNETVNDLNSIATQQME